MTNETIVAKAQTISPVAPEIEMPIPETPDPLLVTILRTKRAHLSQGDHNFRLWLHAKLKGLKQEIQILAEGCVLVRTDPKSDTLFSCHIDTCHNSAESDGSMQDLAYDPAFGDILLGKDSKSGCLGADDGAGIYVMLKMIEAKVPGSYIFHTGEERGGIGSYAVLAKHKTLLEDFSRAIAFDRAVQRGGAPEVIVTQGGASCASIEAGTALCKALNESGAVFEKPYEVSHKGSFTDTKVYSGVVPECFNIGVWYAQQHSNKEWLNVAGLEQLVKACLVVKWDELPVKRTPAPPAPKYASGGNVSGRSTGYGAYQGGFPGFDSDDWDDSPKAKAKAHTGWSVPPAAKFAAKPSVIGMTLLEELETYTLDDMIALCEESPEQAARLLYLLKARYDGARAEIDSMTTMLGVDS